MSDIANIASFEAWNGESGRRWADEASRRDRVLADVADTLLDAAALELDEHVLDIGCGCGGTTLAAARRIGDNGRACGIDLSGPMLDVAGQRGDAAGLQRVAFVQADAQTHHFASSYDIAISRFGTMFFADPVAAFANIGQALRPAGRLCLATWQPLAANAWLMVPGAELLRYGTIPEAATSGPGMFGQSDPVAVTATLQASGYEDVELTPASVALRLGDDVDDATNYLASSGVGRAVLETVPAEDYETAIDAVRAVLAEYAGGDGVWLDGAIWIISARRRR